MAAITQYRCGLWGRRYSSFSDKSGSGATDIELPVLLCDAEAVAPLVVYGNVVQLPALVAEATAVELIIGSQTVVQLPALEVAASAATLSLAVGQEVLLPTIEADAAPVQPNVQTGWVVSLPATKVRATLRPIRVISKPIPYCVSQDDYAATTIFQRDFAKTLVESFEEVCC